MEKENLQKNSGINLHIWDANSKVDYNVIMQLLRYMAGICCEYEKAMKNEKVSIIAKSFRYPPILPVVYYEGSDEWTADMHLKDRILLNELFERLLCMSSTISTLP